jgi:hypothetical protein
MNVTLAPNYRDKLVIESRAGLPFEFPFRSTITTAAASARSLSS